MRTGSNEFDTDENAQCRRETDGADADDRGTGFRQSSSEQGQNQKAQKREGRYEE